MSFIVHANHVRNFERCFTLPDHDDSDKPTWIDWIGELLATLDESHYAVAFVFEHDTEEVSARNVIVVPSVPVAVSVSEVAARSEVLDNPSGILTVLRLDTRTPCLFMLASAGSWTSYRYVTANNDPYDAAESSMDVVPDKVWKAHRMVRLHNQHKAARRGISEGLAL